MGSTKPAHKPKKDELVPIDWSAIEPHFKAGIRSVASIAKQFGCSHVAILKRARKLGWSRDLKPAILERADQLVTAATVTGSVTAGPSVSDQVTIEVNAQALAMVQHAHRTIAADERVLAKQLLAELMAGALEPETFVRVRDLLDALDDEPTPEQKADMRDAMAMLANLPGRVKVLKDLVETTAKIVGMEREAFGLNTEDGTGRDRFTVIIKDYTGRGDPDSPRALEAAEAS